MVTWNWGEQEQWVSVSICTRKAWHHANRNAETGPIFHIYWCLGHDIQEFNCEQPIPLLGLISKCMMSHFGKSWDLPVNDHVQWLISASRCQDPREIGSKALNWPDSFIMTISWKKCLFPKCSHLTLELNVCQCAWNMVQEILQLSKWFLNHPKRLISGI